MPPLTEFQRASFRSGLMSRAQIIDPDTGEPIPSGEQTIRLLGPFRVNWNTAGIETVDGASLSALASGTVVVAVWGYVLTSFAGAEGTLWVGIDLAFGDSAVARTDIELVGPVDVHARGQSGPHLTSTLSVGSTSFPALCSLSTDLGAKLTKTSGNWTAGAADIYALIAEPA